MPKEFQTWADRAAKEMRFFPDREAVRKELTAHMEDRQQDYLEAGLTEAEAAQKTLSAMGDAEETGKLLNKAHSPLLGWAWLASKILAILAVVWLCFLAVDAADEAVRQWKRGGSEQHYCLFYQEHEDMAYVPLAEVGMTRQIGDYTMTLDHGGWYRNPEDDGFFLILGWKVTAKKAWLTKPLGLENLQMETSDGTFYPPYPAVRWPADGPWVLHETTMEERLLPVWTVHQRVDYAPWESGFLPEWFRFSLPGTNLEYTIFMEEGVWP